TYAWVPFIVLKGGEAYSGATPGTKGGYRFFSVSGDVKKPGVHEVSMRLTLGELIEKHCGGVIGGKLKAIAVFRPSGGFLPAELQLNDKIRNHPEWLAFLERRKFNPPPTDKINVLDLELDWDLIGVVSPTRMLGAGLVVYGATRNMVDEAVNAIEFF